MTTRTHDRILGARRRYWFALAFVAGYHMVLTDFTVRAPW